MAETQKTLSALLAQLPDNNTKDIDAEELRDVVVSLFANFAIITADGSAGTQLTNAIAGTQDKVTGFTHDGLDRGVVVADVANDKITVNLDGDYLILWHVSFQGSTNTNYTGHIYVNGADIANREGEWFRGIGTAAQYGSTFSFAAQAVSAGQDIECYIEADGISKNFTPQSMGLFVIKIG